MKKLIKPMLASMMLGVTALGSSGQAFAQVQAEVQPLTVLAAPAPVNPQACISLTSNFGVGSRDERFANQITALQSFLIAKGHLNIPSPSGYFGNMTANAVKEFQSGNGIPATGFVGPLTLEKIKAVCDSSSRNNLPEGITLSVKTDKEEYNEGDDVVITLVAQNTTAKTKVLDFTSGCQTHYTIGEYNSQAAIMCSMALTSVTLRPHAKKTWKMTHEDALFHLEPGTHKITATVNGYGTVSMDVIVKGETAAADTVTVVSPNGNETLRKGKMMDIVWTTPNVTYIQAPCYDISLLPTLPACATATTGPVCRIKMVVYPVATSTIGSAGTSTYAWRIGTLADGQTLPSGKYKVQICTVGGGACDESDDYFSVR